MAVIGGGINGAGIAADAAGRGLRVALFEQGDLAGATSSASTKLVHGGLRYLETYEFSLVRKALKESELLLHLAPHLIKPISIRIPHMAHHRPWLLVRLGLFLYNHLARRPGYESARSIRFEKNGPLVSELTHGFSFSDGQVDDARLVVINALQAARDLADIYVRHECTGLHVAGELWEVALKDKVSNTNKVIRARAVVNATGPWVSQLMEKAVGEKPINEVRLVKGSHLVVPRIQPRDQAYLLQNEDGRVVFVIPYLQDFSMIGTTEEEYSGDPGAVSISNAETDYLLGIVNRYFSKPVKPEDIVQSFTGIRPLIDNKEKSATKASRDYQLEFERTALPLLSVYGGKVTTYRVLAKQAVDRFAEIFPGLKPSNTRNIKLPGADFESPGKLREALLNKYPWLATDLLDRWIHSYGSLAFAILEGADAPADLGIAFGHGLFQREVDYLVQHEWAQTAQDILWRRTKLGLLFDTLQSSVLQDYLSGKLV